MHEISFSDSKSVDKEIGSYLFQTWIYLILLIGLLGAVKVIQNKLVKFIFKWFLLLLATISTINIAMVILIDPPYIKYPSEAYSALQPEGTSYMVPYNGYNLHFRCYDNVNSNCTSSNNQCKTILFESGMPFYSSIWGEVINSMDTELKKNGKSGNSDYIEELSQIKRYCFYDRYGYGWSDFRDEAIGATQMVSDLSNYLSVLGINDVPIIFVGWSYGGAIGQISASKNAFNLEGLVLVDSMDTFDVNDNLINNIADGKNSFLLLDLLRITGIPRFLDMYPLESGYLNSMLPLDARLKYYSNQVFLNSDYLKTAWYELSVLIESLKEMTVQLNQSGNTLSGYPFGSTPLVVLTAGENGDNDWINRQSIIANYSSNSIHIINNNSTHFIPIDSPDSIVNSIIQCISLINNIKKY